MTEKMFQAEIIKYMEAEGWNVIQYVPRQDCVNQDWKRPYTCDFIARHPKYIDLGYVGFEVKDSDDPSLAINQVVTKYQNHVFTRDNIRVPIWITIVHPGKMNILDRALHKFGVGTLVWDHEKIVDFGSNDRTNHLFINSDMMKNSCIYSLEKHVLPLTHWVKHLNGRVRLTDPSN